MPAGASRSHQGCRRDSPGSQGTRGEGWHTPTSPACLPAAAHHGPTMWAGTNSGSVFAYALEVPAAVAGGEKRPERAVEAVLGKEVQLMHRAPVVAIAVLGDPWSQRNVVLGTSDALQALGSHACSHLTRERRWLCCRVALPRAPSWQLPFLLLEEAQGGRSFPPPAAAAHRAPRLADVVCHRVTLSSFQLIFCTVIPPFYASGHSVMSVTCSSGFGISDLKVYYWDSCSSV